MFENEIDAAVWQALSGANPERAQAIGGNPAAATGSMGGMNNIPTSAAFPSANEGSLTSMVLSALAGAVAQSDGPNGTPSPLSPSPSHSGPPRQMLDGAGHPLSRRDPASLVDPLPHGRDFAAPSTAAILSGNDPGKYHPDISALRADPRFGGMQGGSSMGVPAAPRPVSPQHSHTPSSHQDLPPWLAAGTPASHVTGPNTSGVQTGHHFAHGAYQPKSHSFGRIRDDFPILSKQVNGKRLVWLDNGATTQKPNSVIRSLTHFYENDNSNVHRGAHTLAARATDAYEHARARVNAFLGGNGQGEVVFVRGTTEAINLVAQSWGKANIGKGDEILISYLEHHANIVPWQHLVEETGATLRVMPVADNGDIRMEAYESMLSPRVKLVAVTHIANTIGTVVPIGPMAAMAKMHGARFLVDGAQSVAHMPIDLGCMPIDFFVFSGHKIYGPTGIGALWARKDVLQSMPPWQRGGSMIRDVTFERSTFADPPARFEAGTPSLADAVGLAAAIDYVDGIGRPRIAELETSLLEQLLHEFASMPKIRVLGSPTVRAGSVSFVVDGVPPIEVAKHLDRDGIAVRAGHHCAQPILRRYGYEQTVRASMGVYNEPADVEAIIRSLRHLCKS